MEERHEELSAGLTQGSKVPRPKSKVSATGFLVRHNLVLTNRHVVQLIADEHQKTGHFEHWYVQFTYPGREGGLTETIKRIVNLFAFIDPSGADGIDVGLLEFRREKDDFDNCAPVEFGDLTAIAVGTDIAVCGFPLGNALLGGSGVWRFGPVLHHGIVSGVAPFEAPNPRHLTSFLTDINTAGGMSGSPVFTPGDGKVLGLHFGGVQGTVGCAMPVDRQRVDGWVRYYERMSVDGQRPDFPLMTDSGDITEQ
jgi:V8-like Glu-specific endopeptidase